MSSPISGVGQIAQRAIDLHRATAFYRDVLGLRHIATFDPPGLVFFDLGDGTRLLLEGGAPSSLVYLTVEGIEGWVARLRAAGVEVASDPHVIYIDEHGTFGDKGVEEWMAFFHDSEENLIGLVERRPGQPAAS